MGNEYAIEGGSVEYLKSEGEAGVNTEAHRPPEGLRILLGKWLYAFEDLGSGNAMLTLDVERVRLAISSIFCDCEAVTDDNLGAFSSKSNRNAELAVDNQWDWETVDWFECVFKGAKLKY